MAGGIPSCSLACAPATCSAACTLGHDCFCCLLTATQPSQSLPCPCGPGSQPLPLCPSRPRSLCAPPGQGLSPTPGPAPGSWQALNAVELVGVSVPLSVPLSCCPAPGSSSWPLEESLWPLTFGSRVWETTARGPAPARHLTLILMLVVLGWLCTCWHPFLWKVKGCCFHKSLKGKGEDQVEIESDGLKGKVPDERIQASCAVRGLLECGAERWPALSDARWCPVNGPRAGVAGLPGPRGGSE